MKLIFLGSGSAANIGNHNFHSNMLLVNDRQKTLLIDCGSDLRHALYERGLSYKDISDIYISHLHADHTGGLEILAFSTKFDPDYQTKPKLYLSDALVEPLWNTVLSGGLSSLEGDIATLSTYFEVHAIKNNVFLWQSLEIHLIKTLHVMSGNVFMPSFGLTFKTIEGLSVLITTDTRFNPEGFHDSYVGSDIIFHDCETDPRRSGVHAHYQDLITLDPKIKEKIWLYHYNSPDLPNAKRDGFRGFVRKGHVFDFSDSSTLF